MNASIKEEAMHYIEVTKDSYDHVRFLPGNTVLLDGKVVIFTSAYRLYDAFFSIAGGLRYRTVPKDRTEYMSLRDVIEMRDATEDDERSAKSAADALREAFQYFTTHYDMRGYLDGSDFRYPSCLLFPFLDLTDAFYYGVCDLRESLGREGRELHTPLPEEDRSELEAYYYADLGGDWMMLLCSGEEEMKLYRDFFCFSLDHYLAKYAAPCER